MKTALTVITTAILTAIAFLYAWQQGFLGGSSSYAGGGFNTTAGVDGSCDCSDACDGEAKECDTLAVTGEGCIAPWGDDVGHAQSILSFVEDTSDDATGCVGITSTCNDGEWLDDVEPATYRSCSFEGSVGIASDEQPCLVGDVLVPHESSYAYYKSAGNGTYTTQTRTCSNGQLDGDSSYALLNLVSSCKLEIEEVKEAAPVVRPVVQPAVKTYTPPAEPKYARCSAPGGGIWEHGKAGTAYTASSVPFGQSCTPVSVVCGYGSMRYGTAGSIGNAVGQTLYTSCSVGPASPCESACGVVQHGASTTTYTESTIPHGSGRTCNDAKVVSTCTNGNLSPNAGSACSCEVAPPSPCTAPNGQTVSHSSSLTLYQYPQVQAVAGDGSDTCVRQWRQCINGSWHDYGGTPASFTFQYASCEVLAPPAGGGPGGEGIPQG